jgi:RNA polymerase sigma-70 factor (ECF subfamily)
MDPTGRDNAERTQTTEIQYQDDTRLVEALRAGDEAAFAWLVEKYHGQLIRLAMVYVSNRAVAEEVAQEAWLGVLEGLKRFEGRSSLKTWLFRIVMNCARTRAVREARSIPFSAFWDASTEPYEPAVEPERFLPAGHPDWPGHWSAATRPKDWSDTPENLLLASETRAHIDRAIAALPPSQHEVITMRDVNGWSSEEVRNALGISETNQRVLLHRARSKVRRALEQYIAGDKGK